MKKFTTMLVLSVLFCASAFAQNRTLSGTVVSATDGLAVIGATVIIEGTNSGSITDHNGAFEIPNVNGAVKVDVSFMGYDTQVVDVAASQTKVDVVLKESSLALDDVIVTGLGISRAKKALGYAVQEVDGEEFSNVRTGNVVNSLSGRVAGVQVTSASGQLGGGAKINIRGNTSLYGNNQPLFVVDGVPISNADLSVNSGSADASAGAYDGYNMGNLASDISPDDIESMSVLKGASATAIYGSRGANGVVLITTKKGKQGDKGFGVSINSSVAFDQVGILPQYQKLYGGGSGDFQEVTIDGKTYNYPGYASDISWGPKYDASTMILPWYAFDKDSYPQDYLQEVAWIYPENDYTTYFQTGVTLTNSVQISKASDNYSFRLSYANSNQTGITENSEQKRNTVSFNGTAKLNKYLDAFASGSYTNTATTGRQQTGYGDNNTTKNMFQWSHTQLDYEKMKQYIDPLTGAMRTWNRRSYNNANGAYIDNPYWTLYENYQNDTRNRFFGNAGMNLKVGDFKLTGRAGIDTYAFDSHERTAIGSVGTPDYTTLTRTATEVNADLFLTYNKRFNDEKIGVSAMVGTTTNNRRTSLAGGSTLGGLVVPGVYNLSNSVSNALVFDDKSWRRINSIYGNATFDYAQTVYLDITARNDWSSTLPENNRSFFYPSVNLSLMLNELGSLKDISWLSFAKLRAGWAEVGNDTDVYNIQNYYTILTPFGTDSRFDISNRLRNENLKPEITRSWEVGLEAQFFNNRLGFDFAYYQKATIDQIIPAAVSGSTGYLYQYINAGELYNSGIELTVNGTPIASKGGFTWDITANIATLNNEVREIAPGIDYLQLATNGFSVESGASLGQSYPVIYGTDFVYDDLGNKLIGSNGQYLKSEKKAIADVTPDFTAGLSNTFSYKNFELSVLLDMQLGGSMYYLTNKYGMYSGILEESAMASNVPGATGDIREDGYIIDGVLAKTTTVNGVVIGHYIDANGNDSDAPVTNEKVVSGQAYSAAFNSGPDAQNVFSTDYIKLREVRIGYTFPSKMTGPIKNLKLSAFGRNLATFMRDNQHFDPEYLQAAGANGQGLEGGYIPTTSTFGFSVGLSF